MSVRRKRIGRRSLASAALVALACGALAAEGPHEIRLERPLEAGARYRIAAEGLRSTTSEMTRAGEVLRREETTLRVELQGLVEIRRVDDAGRPLEQAVGLDYLVWGLGGGLDQALPTGRVVIAETVGRRTEFRLDQGTLPPRAAEALGLVLSTYRGDVPSEDLVFGSRMPRAVGESWDFDRQALVDTLRAMGAVVDAARLEGQVTLEGIERIEGLSCLRVTAVVGAPVSALADLPADLALGSGRMDVRVSGAFPTDPSRPRVENRTSISMELVLEGRGRLAGAVVTTRSTQTGKKTLAPF